MLRVFIVNVFLTFAPVFADYLHIIPVIPNDVAIVANGGRPDAPVKVEFFMDLACPDSQRNFIEMTRAIGKFSPQQVRVELYQFMLPWHRNAFVAAKGLYYVQEVKPEKTIDYIKKVFETIPEFSTRATQDKTEFQIVRALAKNAASVTGLDEESLYKNITSNHYKQKIVYCSKLGYQRGAKGTPWIFVNGAETILGPMENFFITSDRWTAMINDILRISAKNELVAYGFQQAACEANASQRSGKFSVALMIICTTLYGFVSKL
ncbi:uncharacterized protein LOC141907339 [Tubulanus polymorphus]|uniref:uncharacterized protein LOC141907339 n=1 Tax=Tubulanus polymorphus TaxID=672921 RepID=UPI003DA34B58